MNIFHQMDLDPAIVGAIVGGIIGILESVATIFICAIIRSKGKLTSNHH
ncbi:MAG: hypothetical protein LLG42_06280 [Chloroflexi bacterium]|nr:hypothetical protein [Chloroflexota bacterium]